MEENLRRALSLRLPPDFLASFFDQNTKIFALTLRRFISYSIIIHIVAIFLLLVLPQKKHGGFSVFTVSIGAQNRILLDSLSNDLPKEPRKLLVDKTVSFPSSSTIIQAQKASQEISSVIQKLQNKEKQNDQNAVQEKAPVDRTIIPPGTGFSFGTNWQNLADYEMFEKIAAQGEHQIDKSVFVLDSYEFHAYDYLKHLKETIEMKWQYPLDASLKGMHGDLYLSFTIYKDGTISDVELIKSTGNDSLDREVASTIKAASPFKPFPEGWKKDFFKITGHFVYLRDGIFLK